MSSTKEPRPIAALVSELETARAVLIERQGAETAARLATTEARNTVNRLQREVEEAFATLSRGAPCGTDWHSARQPRHPA